MSSLEAENQPFAYTLGEVLRHRRFSDPETGSISNSVGVTADNGFLRKDFVRRNKPALQKRMDALREKYKGTQLGSDRKVLLMALEEYAKGELEGGFAPFVDFIGGTASILMLPEEFGEIGISTELLSDPVFEMEIRRIMLKGLHKDMSDSLLHADDVKLSGNITSARQLMIDDFEARASVDRELIQQLIQRGNQNGLGESTQSTPKALSGSPEF